jgi:hypothetical protein
MLHSLLLVFNAPRKWTDASPHDQATVLEPMVFVLHNSVLRGDEVTQSHRSYLSGVDMKEQHENENAECFGKGDDNVVNCQCKTIFRSNFIHSHIEEIVSSIREKVLGEKNDI